MWDAYNQGVFFEGWTGYDTLEWVQMCPPLVHTYNELPRTVVLPLALPLVSLLISCQELSTLDLDDKGGTTRLLAAVSCNLGQLTRAELVIARANVYDARLPAAFREACKKVDDISGPPPAYSAIAPNGAGSGNRGFAACYGEPMCSPILHVLGIASFYIVTGYCVWVMYKFLRVRELAYYY